MAVFNQENKGVAKDALPIDGIAENVINKFHIVNICRVAESLYIVSV